MAGNTFGRLFTVTTFGESHGPALGAIVDGCPPGLALASSDLQRDLDRRKPGKSRHTTQRRETDEVQILSGTFEGRTTGTPIGLLIHNIDQRSKDYSKIMDRFRPGHADYTYTMKYGHRDYRGGGRSSARETAMRVAAGAVAAARMSDGRAAPLGFGSDLLGLGDHAELGFDLGHPLGDVQHAVGVERDRIDPLLDQEGGELPVPPDAAVSSFADAVAGEARPLIADEEVTVEVTGHSWEREIRIEEFKARAKLVEAQRTKQRTR